jgi:ABC-type phosphate transport system auxiliary subunit
MKEKIKAKLQDAVKDYGLSEEAIESLVSAASKGLKDDASDEDITKAVNTFAEIGKAMQGETTRKVQAAKKQFEEDSKKLEDETKGKKEDPSKDMPDSFKTWKAEIEKTIKTLQDENAALKSEKKSADRASEIAGIAKELGIPDYLMKNYAIADDADARKQLTEFKQDLVNNKLLPKDAGGNKITEDAAIAQEAEDWVKNLPEQ